MTRENKRVSTFAWKGEGGWQDENTSWERHYYLPQGTCSALEQALISQGMKQASSAAVAVAPATVWIKTSEAWSHH